MNCNILSFIINIRLLDSMQREKAIDFTVNINVNIIIIISGCININNIFFILIPTHYLHVVEFPLS